MVEFEQFGHGKTRILGLHGWFGGANTFAPLELSLDADEFHCAWIAHRGYGRSRDMAGNFNMAEMAKDAIAVADRLGWDRFNVIGHSMGGKAAQLVASSVPGRVQKLVAVTPVPAGNLPLDEAARSLFSAAADDESSRRIIIDFSTGHQLSPTWIGRLARQSMASSTPQAVAAYFKSWADDNLVEKVRGCSVETLVLVGANDPSITPQVVAAGFKDHFANLEIVVLPNSGHYPMDECPLAIGAHVRRFVSGAPIGAAG